METMMVFVLAGPVLYVVLGLLIMSAVCSLCA